MTEENKRKLAKELANTPCEATINVWADAVEHDGPYVKHIRLA